MPSARTNSTSLMPMKANTWRRNGSWKSAGESADRAVLGVLEGAAGHGHAVDPGLQRGRNAEVVHRRADHHDVGVQELLHHLFSIGRLGGIGLGQRTAAQMRYRIGVKIAIIDLQAIDLAGEAGDHGGRQLAGPGIWNSGMHDLNDLYYFAMVVDHGGFAAAERALGIPKSRLSRRISQLETDLGRAPPRADHAGRGAGRTRSGGPPQRGTARRGARQRAGVAGADAAAQAAAQVPGAVPEGAPAAEHQQPPRGHHQ
ncbi:hypothetical protein G6F68_011357 [Rhizopus microsporus]|nr:hypothetical protein G6F68_011357 [Rhizopus microsporus]